MSDQPRPETWKEHTPGPWKWFDYPDGRKLLAGPNRAVIHCPDAPITCEPADERLIAAAPDLLAALRVALNALRIGPAAVPGSYMADVLEIGDAAIVKAEDTSAVRR
jgi:hypothetical protein